MSVAPKRDDPDAAEPWSLRIVTVAGIPIRLHFTFLLMLVYVGVSSPGRNAWAEVLFLIGLFGCVALHELGHALTALRYRYPVRQIVLYPIGGVASMEGSPTPANELWIALAGPAVNVVIAGLLIAYFQFATPDSLPERLQMIHLQRGQFLSGGGLLTRLCIANLSLALFNLIPAFPMDGGRVLRALLAMKLPREVATARAAGVGQALAMLLGVFGLLGGHFVLALIALFVFFAAGQETAVENERVATEDVPVRAAMITKFVTLTSGATLREAADTLLATHQQDFPVIQGDAILGVLSRDQLLRGLVQEGEGAYVAGAMTREVLFADPDDPLDAYLMRSDGVARAPALVRDDTGKLIGMVTRENVMEFLMLQRIARLRQREQGNES